MALIKGLPDTKLIVICSAHSYLGKNIFHTIGDVLPERNLHAQVGWRRFPKYMRTPVIRTKAKRDWEITPTEAFLEGRQNNLEKFV